MELKPFELLKDVGSLDEFVEELADKCQVPDELIKDAYPCSSLQEGLIALTIKQPGAYVARNVFRLSSDVDVFRFQAAWQRTVDVLDILRTRVVHTESSRLIQVVLQPLPIMWQSAKTLNAAADSEQLLPEHNGGPLTQYTIVGGRGSKERYFIWTIHHALYDGWSMPMVLKRVESAYFDNTVPWPKSVYGKFIKYLGETSQIASDRFWKSRLEGVSPLHFPQTPRTAVDKTPSCKQIIHTAKFSRDAAKLGITTSTVVRAAWAALEGRQPGTRREECGPSILRGPAAPAASG